MTTTSTREYKVIIIYNVNFFCYYALQNILVEQLSPYIPQFEFNIFETAVTWIKWYKHFLYERKTCVQINLKAIKIFDPPQFCNKKIYHVVSFDPTYLQ